MKTVFAKVHSWENASEIASDIDLASGDVVILETGEGHVEGAIVSSGESSSRKKDSASGRILRKANLNDLKIMKAHREKAAQAADFCRKEIKRLNLPMKIIDADYSFDGGGILFAFIADGRIDFRDLVKNLSRKFQRSIRLHQVGARDESRQRGGYGICGRELCCVKFKNNLPSITSDMAKIQQIGHRGSERISGVCGRLMCCLAFEADQYREILEKYPAPGKSVSYKGKAGIVREINALSGEIKLELEDKSVLMVKLSEIK